MLCKDELLELYVVQELTQEEIAEQLGVTRRTVGNWFRKCGIPIRSTHEAFNIRRAKKGVTLDNVMALVGEGMLLGEIADYFGVSRSTISKLLSDNGINMQNHEEQRKRQSMRMSINNPVPKGSKRGREALKPALDRFHELFLLRAASVTDFKAYAKIARGLAATYYKNEFPKYTSIGLVIDHKFSIKDCFDHGVPLVLVSHPNNLRLVTQAENLCKGANSIVTFEEFCDLVHWNGIAEDLSYGAD